MQGAQGHVLLKRERASSFSLAFIRPQDSLSLFLVGFSDPGVRLLRKHLQWLVDRSHNR